MGSTPASVPRERDDTKTLVRLGADRESAPVPTAQGDLLRDIANEGDAKGNRVQLWFKGLQAPVRARVRISGEVIRLETLLPFLEIDSEVAIARDEDSARLHARIAQVSLVASGEQPVPRLSVEVAIARDTAQHQAGAVAPNAATASAADSTAKTSPVPAPSPNGASLPSAQGNRVLPWVAAFVLGVVGGAAGTGAWLAPWLRAPFAAPVHRRDLQPEGAEAAPPLQAATVIEAVPTPVAQAQAQAPTVVDPAVEPEFEPPAQAEAEAAPQPEAEAAGVPEVEAAPEAAAVPEAEAALEAEPTPEAAPSEPAATRGLEVESANGQTEIFIPMQGSADGMERYALTTPGVSFTLPHAQALIAASNYVVDHRPLVRRVWLREHAGGVQVRIILPRASIHDDARFDADGLHIILRP